MPPFFDLSPQAVEAWGHWLGNVAPFGAPVLTGVFAWLIGRKERVSKIQSMEKEHQKFAEDEAAAVIDAITRRFQALIDGYEARVKDLLEEIQSLRTEVMQLRSALFPKHPEEKHDGTA